MAKSSTHVIQHRRSSRTKDLSPIKQHLPAKRSTSAKTTTRPEATLPPKVPRHCRQCPDRPLRSQCMHTVSGRLYLESVRNVIQPIENLTVATNLGLPALASLESNSLGPTFSSPPPILESFQPSQTVQTNPFLLNALSCRRSDPQTPQRLNQTNQFPGADTPDASMPPHIEYNPSPSVFPTPSQDVASSGLINSNNYVEGVYRGNQPYLIKRSRELPALKVGSEASRHYNKMIKDIINRCERLAHSSGAWIFFTGNYSNARQDFVHYSSPKFRLEAREEIENVTNKFDEIFDNLITARRVDAFQKQTELRRRIQERDALLQEKEDAITVRDRLAEDLLTRLAVAEGRLKDAGLQ